MVIRGKNWRNDEDIALCTAFSKISNYYAIVGASREVLWNGIWKEFVTMCPDHHNRESSKISRRWNNIIQPAIAKFSGVFGRVMREMGSDESSADLLANALTQFKLENDREFAFMHCWDVLRHEDQFNPDLEDQQDIVGSPNAITNPVANSSERRAKGRKRSLPEAREMEHHRDLNVDFKRIASLLESRNEVLKDATEVAMISAVDDELSRRYFDLKRRSIVEQLEKQRAIVEQLEKQLEQGNRACVDGADAPAE